MRQSLYDEILQPLFYELLRRFDMPVVPILPNIQLHRIPEDAYVPIVNFDIISYLDHLCILVPKRDRNSPCGVRCYECHNDISPCQTRFELGDQLYYDNDVAGVGL